jgi:hypothetical protein
MALTIQLPPESELKLRRQAAAVGRDAAEYASDIIRSAVDLNADPSPAIDRTRLQQAVRELLRRSAELLPSLSGPIVADPKKAWSEFMEEKARKQGLQL